MASNQPSRKFGGKVDRKSFLRDWGWRAVTKSENPGLAAKRWYIHEATGELAPRRSVEKRAVGTFEKFARRNELARGRESPQKEVWAQAKVYAKKNGMTTRDAIKSEGFKHLRAVARYDLRNKSASPKRIEKTTRRRLEALYQLDEITDEQFDEYIAHYMGEE